MSKFNDVEHICDVKQNFVMLRSTFVDSRVAAIEKHPPDNYRGHLTIQETTTSHASSKIPVSRGEPKIQYVARKDHRLPSLLRKRAWWM